MLGMAKTLVEEKNPIQEITGSDYLNTKLVPYSDPQSISSQTYNISLIQVHTDTKIKQNKRDQSKLTLDIGVLLSVENLAKPVDECHCDVPLPLPFQYVGLL